MAQWLEHCVSSAKVVGFDSQGTHILTKKIIACKSLWIKASAKCINVNVNVKYLPNIGYVHTVSAYNEQFVLQTTRLVHTAYINKIWSSLE